MPHVATANLLDRAVTRQHHQHDNSAQTIGRQVAIRRKLSGEPPPGEVAKSIGREGIGRALPLRARNSGREGFRTAADEQRKADQQGDFERG
jgi:hypothetical protein